MGVSHTEALSSVENCLAALESATGHPATPKPGGGFMARCPVPTHKDENASLSIDAGDQCPVVVKCFGGCSFASIMAAIGATNGKHISALDSFEVKPAKPKQKQKYFATMSEAHNRLAQCLRAQEDAETADFLKESYDLDPEEIPANWRVFSPYGSPGITYPYQNAAANDGAIKFRPIKRDDHGKRKPTFLAGEDPGATALTRVSQANPQFRLKSPSQET